MRTTITWVMNREIADCFIKALATEPNLVEADVYDHEDKRVEWTWNATFLKSRKWTLHKGWYNVNDDSFNESAVMVCNHKGRRHIVRIQPMAWNWFERITSMRCYIDASN